MLQSHTNDACNLIILQQGERIWIGEWKVRKLGKKKKNMGKEMWDSHSPVLLKIRHFTALTEASHGSTAANNLRNFAQCRVRNLPCTAEELLPDIHQMHVSRLIYVTFFGCSPVIYRL